jgi:hypothetical protein
VSGNLTVSPGARKEGRALGAGSLYLPSYLEVAFSESNFRLEQTSIGNILLFIVTSGNEESRCKDDHRPTQSNKG